MIGFLSGRVLGTVGEQLLLKTPSGVGYLLFVDPKFVYHIGDIVDMYVLQVIREDSQTLFGFERLEDRDGIEKLLKVDGVGPKTAATILYTLGWHTVLQAIHNEDYKTLATVKGLGAKTAKKIVLELKGASTNISNLAEATPKNTVEYEQVITAITNMGYKKNDVVAAYNRIAANALFNPQDVMSNIRKVLRELN